MPRETPQFREWRKIGRTGAGSCAGGAGVPLVRTYGAQTRQGARGREEHGEETAGHGEAERFRAETSVKPSPAGIGEQGAPGCGARLGMERGGRAAARALFPAQHSAGERAAQGRGGGSAPVARRASANAGRVKASGCVPRETPGRGSGRESTARRPGASRGQKADMEGSAISTRRCFTWNNRRAGRMLKTWDHGAPKRDGGRHRRREGISRNVSCATGGWGNGRRRTMKRYAVPRDGRQSRRVPRYRQGDVSRGTIIGPGEC